MEVIKTVSEQYRDILVLADRTNWRISRLHVQCTVPYGILRRWDTGVEWRNIGRSFATLDEATTYIAGQPDTALTDPAPLTPTASPVLVDYLRGEMAHGRLSREDLVAFANKMSNALAFVAVGFDVHEIRVAAWRDAARVVLQEAPR